MQTNNDQHCMDTRNALHDTSCEKPRNSSPPAKLGLYLHILTGAMALICRQGEWALMTTGSHSVSVMNI